MDRKMREPQLPFGTLRLDETGAVLSYEADRERLAKVRASDIIGLNFFEEIAPAEQTEEMRARFDDIMSGGKNGRRSSLFILFERPAAQIQILRTPADGRAEGGRGCSAIVRIAPARRG
jgi:photoactive yellow protein